MKHIILGDHPLHLKAPFEQNLVCLADLGLALRDKRQQQQAGGAATTTGHATRITSRSRGRTEESAGSKGLQERESAGPNPNCGPAPLLSLCAAAADRGKLANPMHRPAAARLDTSLE